MTGMKGLILDLRDDPGGLLEAAVKVSDLFVKSGKIVSTKGRNKADQVYEAEEDGTYADFPMVVLINQNSASASEIVAACLQDHDRAEIVGQRSFGKGSVQNILPLDNGNSVLKLTVATYWRPSGKNIHRFKDAKPSDEWGVSPDEDLEVKLSNEEYEKWYEARLKRDQLHTANRSDSKDDDSPEVREDDPKAEQDQGNVFVDHQLDKALEVDQVEAGRGNRHGEEVSRSGPECGSSLRSDPLTLTPKLPGSR